MCLAIASIKTCIFCFINFYWVTYKIRGKLLEISNKADVCQQTVKMTSKMSYFSGEPWELITLTLWSELEVSVLMKGKWAKVWKQTSTKFHQIFLKSFLNYFYVISESVVIWWLHFILNEIKLLLLKKWLLLMILSIIFDKNLEYFAISLGKKHAASELLSAELLCISDIQCCFQ